MQGPSHLAAFRNHGDRRAKLVAERLALPGLCPTCTRLLFTAGVCLPDPRHPAPVTLGFFWSPEPILPECRAAQMCQEVTSPQK